MSNQPQIQLPPVNYTAAGETEDLREANLQMAQQIPGYADATLLIADAISKRVEQVLMDYTRDAVVMKYQIDGMWHELPRRDRQSGDAMLASMKCLGGMDPRERRAKQNGTFKVQFMKVKGPCTLTTQGVQTGERAILDLTCNRVKLERLEDLGMREKMRERIRELFSADKGLIIISSMPKGGLTTTWTACLNETDRFMRDFASVQSKSYSDPDVLNVAPNVYDPSKGETFARAFGKLILREPEVLVFPEMNNEETARIAVEQVTDGERLVVTRLHAKSADEALLRMLMLKPSTEKLAKAVHCVINSRLVRRLCETCRQPFQPAPQMLQKLGIPQGRVQVFYKPYQPPPTPPVDDKGNPIPQPICPQCQGLGFIGRTAIFEVLVVNDQIRKALATKPKLDVLRRIVKETGHNTLQEEGILLVCQGVTSLTELQRALTQ